jgi:hypothetical protein
MVGILLVVVQPGVSWCQNEASASTPVLSAVADQSSASLGSIVTLTLEYRLPENAELPDDPKIGGLEDLTIIERTTKPGTISIKLLVDRIDSLKTGTLSIAYLDEAGNTQVMTTDPISLTVLSNLGDKPAEAQLRPIQGIIPTQPLWLKYLPWGAGLIGVLLLLGGVLWWQKNKRIQNISAELVDPPHVRAKKELEELLLLGLFEKGQVKGFFFCFSEILRRYLEAIRGFPAAELTTEEIALRIDDEQDRMLVPLLRGADLVKFADARLTPARKEEEVQKAFSYIDETSPLAEGGHCNEAVGISQRKSQ